jgi:N-acetylmuramoyl-L-alanine amidase
LPTSDRVHFEYGSGASVYAQKNLIAFQRLWNRHNPTAKIAEDGIYGPATGNALSKSPCNGWAAAALNEAEPVPIENELFLAE